MLDAAVKAHAAAEAAAAAHREGLEAAVAQAALEAASAALQEGQRRVQELKDRNRHASAPWKFCRSDCRISMSCLLHALLTLPTPKILGGTKAPASSSCSPKYVALQS